MYIFVLVYLLFKTNFCNRNSGRNVEKKIEIRNDPVLPIADIKNNIIYVLKAKLYDCSFC